MIKYRLLLLIFCFFINKSWAIEEVNWRDPKVKEALGKIGESINGFNFDKKNTDLLSFSFGSRTGVDAVEFLLSAGEKVTAYRDHPSSYPEANIFSLLGRAIYDGFFEHRNLEDAAKYFIWGLYAESRDLLDPSSQFAAAFIGEVLDSLPDLKTKAKTEAAIKALHEKLVEEAEVEEKASD
jgi:hypothetical protein